MILNLFMTMTNKNSHRLSKVIITRDSISDVYDPKDKYGMHLDKLTSDYSRPSLAPKSGSPHKYIE